MHLHLSFMLSCCLSVFVWLFSLFCLFFKIKKEKLEKKIQKQCLFVYVGTCVPLMAIETKFLNFVSLVAKISISMHN